jgi:radical SAM superfamily enzyme YgiQ (UPF0313 family)
MKVSISYPPLESGKGVPLLGQNRQFQWFSHPCYIYPMVPAYAATLLKENGYEVFWHDGIAEEWTLQGYLDRIERDSPELIALESKTAVIKAHWRIIEEIKSRLPDSKTVLLGDHVTALPRESMEMSKVDYVLTGGDYDFLLLSLCDHLTEDEPWEPGIWYREGGEIKNTGPFQLDHDLDALPLIDRDLTRWHLYSEKNGNYRRTPGTYTMVGRDCWWGKCRFCSWTTTYPRFRIRRPESLLDEIGMLIERYGVREVFDDTGTFPTGKWLERFCQGMIDRGYNEKIHFSCNMRFGVLRQEHYNLLKRAGFRMLLFGLESANQATLDRLDKGIRVEDITAGCEMARKAGLEPHLTVMVGYPWETKKDAKRTLDLARELFGKGYADTLQATLVVPYPGTPLFEECRRNGWLKTEEWEKYDMRSNVMHSPMDDEEVNELIQNLYKVFFTPQYLVRKLLSIRSLSDLHFVRKGIAAISGHLRDFSTRNTIQTRRDGGKGHA